MEGMGVSLATEVLSSLAGKLGAMLVEEAGLLSGVRDEVVSIKDELASMSEFLKCAEELPEEASERCFNELINRSLIQPWQVGLSGKVRSCRVHDVIRELILSKSKKEMYISVLGVEGDHVRHLSVLEGSSSRVVDLDQNMRLDCVRSLIAFSHDGLASLISPRMRLLRVLDLQDCKFSGTTFFTLPRAIICKFLHLKYLSLRDKYLRELPKSIGNLQNLETLEICRIWDGAVKIPPTVVKLQQLRHLIIGKGFESELSLPLPMICHHFDSEYGMSLPRGVGNLKALQTLYYVNARHSSEGTMRELAGLTQLRKLGVIGLTEETAMEFCTALEKLSSCLRSLSVETAKGFEGYGFLDSLSSPPLHLQSLSLGGYLRVLPRWVDSLRDVAKIVLFGHGSKEEFLLQLRTLPSLINLHLGSWGNYVHLWFHREGFQSLKTLSLDATKYSTISMKFFEGAMPNLQKLRISDSRLELLQGMKYLASLKEIELYRPREENPRKLEDIVRVHPNNPRLVLSSSDRVTA